MRLTVRRISPPQKGACHDVFFRGTLRDVRRDRPGGAHGVSVLRTDNYRADKGAGLPVRESTEPKGSAFSPVDNQPQQVNSLITTE